MKPYSTKVRVSFNIRSTMIIKTFELSMHELYKLIVRHQERSVLYKQLRTAVTLRISTSNMNNVQGLYIYLM